MNFEANRAVRLAARKLIIQDLTPWLQGEYSTFGGGTVVRFPRIWMSSRECRMQPFPAAIVATGLLALLPACASNFQDRCLEQGYDSGSPEFSDCVENEISQARRDRRRHRSHGGGGGGR